MSKAHRNMRGHSEFKNGMSRAYLKFKKKILFFFNVYLFLRERETERQSASRGRGHEKGRHIIQSRLQVPSCQHRAGRGAPTHKPSDHDRDLSQSQMLN